MKYQNFRYRNFPYRFAGFLFLALVAGLCFPGSLPGGWKVAWADSPPPWTEFSREGKAPSLAPMLERVTPAVVNVATESQVQVRRHPFFSDPFFRRFFEFPERQPQRKTQSLGSGVIVDAERGLILTNNHVIAQATRITVALSDGRVLQAELAGSDPETDVAVLRVRAPDLQAMAVVDSEVLRVGDFVVAIGNPFGIGQSVTSGIVSGLGRSGLSLLGYEDFIQTDADINPGNSGGALVNLHGELIGINTAIYSRSGGSIGIGFAIPIHLALRVMEQLLEYGEVRRADLGRDVGLQVQDIGPDLAAAFKLRQGRGVVVSRVFQNSPAERAGFQSGDVILSVNERPVHSEAELRNQLGLAQVGQDASFQILREGQARSLQLSLQAVARPPAPERAVNPLLRGLSLQEVEGGGLQVVRLEKASPAWNVGLRPGDRLLSVNRGLIQDLQGFLRAVDGQENLLLQVQRGSRVSFLLLR